MEPIGRFRKAMAEIAALNAGTKAKRGAFNRFRGNPKRAKLLAGAVACLIPVLSPAFGGRVEAGTVSRLGFDVEPEIFRLERHIVKRAEPKGEKRISVYFEVGKSELSDRAQGKIRAFIARNSGKVELRSFTSRDGGRKRNADLRRKRSESVNRFILSLDRYIQVEIVSNANPTWSFERGHAHANRKTEISIGRTK